MLENPLGEKKMLVGVATLASLLFDSKEDTGRRSLSHTAMPTGEEKGFSDAISLRNPLPPSHTDTEIKDENTRVVSSIGTH